MWIGGVTQNCIRPVADRMSDSSPPPVRFLDTGDGVLPSKRTAAHWNVNRTTFPPSDPRYASFGTPRKETMLNLAADTPPGHFVELGVYQGGTAWRLARLAVIQQRECHLFDTFRGIPESTPSIDTVPAGNLADTDLETVARLVQTAVFHVGVFPMTMPRGLGPVAFAHVDFSQYRSCLAAIDHLYPLLVLGGVMLFDDYNVTPGARKAVNDRFGLSITRTREGKAYVKR
jgi:O-methyltransferase